ncbi:peptide synthetase [Methylovirgula ligni]|uniref:Amino acid synthesis protein n=1 Tax=Methylovirgula ligni TaxID=569860 RepID=A0A3D9YUY1_9HYPH|nr:amino acid synthesis family protein [Methylovirgula ligni]QAY96034.1 peptide synthetase [Methylovirgula ligni]REF86294.1 amino acid synthesis protein [Methylovirgula ligni]
MTTTYKTAIEGYEIRAWYDFVQEIEHEGGAPGNASLIKAATAVVIRNPFADHYVADLSKLIGPSAELGRELGRRAAGLLKGRPVESYGKGGIAGTAGEQEHVVACITTIFGDAFRAAVGGGKAWISSVSKTGAAGTMIDIPLAYKDELYVRSHYDAISLVAPDAPRPNELLICVGVATGGRIHQRVGGKTKAEVLQS